MFHTWFCCKLNKPDFWKCIADDCDSHGQPMNEPSHVLCKSKMSLNMYNSTLEEEVSSDSIEGKFYTFL